MGQVARTLVGTFGRSATLRRPGGGGGYNPATGLIEAPGSSTDYTCEVVFEDFAQAQIDGTLVRAGDRKALVSRLRLGTEPVPQSDVLIEGGRTWQIVRLLGYSSGAQEAAYTLHVRR